MQEITDYLKILTDKEEKDFVVINSVSALKLYEKHCILH